MTTDPRHFPTAIERTLELLRPDRRPARPEIRDGYLDLLGAEDPTGDHPGQRLMTSGFLPRIYEGIWRPALGQLLMGAVAPTMSAERRLARIMLEVLPGDRVLDVGCGPGTFTRDLADAAGDGLVVGLDASPTMLQRGLLGPHRPNLAYVRGDACALPFADDTFDAVCCFAALYLIEDPMAAIDEITRVLAPGGRVALLASCHRGPLPVHRSSHVVHALTGVRMFGREELIDALEDDGLEDIRQRVSGLGQFVWARDTRAPAF